VRRYWFHPEDKQENKIHLRGDLFHHVVEVCRQIVGSRFEMLTVGGQAYFVELQEVGKKQAIAVILENRQVLGLKKPYIHLAVSVPRFAKMDTIVEKAVELGVYELHPFVSDFSFVRKVDYRLQGKFPRWQRIVQGATQQSGRGNLMSLAEPVVLEELLDNFKCRTRAVGLFPYEGEALQHLRQALDLLKGDKADEIWIFVGSEGGYSRREVQLFESFSLEPVTLGSQVLRVETACLALVSILKYEWDLMN